MAKAQQWELFLKAPGLRHGEISAAWNLGRDSKHLPRGFIRGGVRRVEQVCVQPAINHGRNKTAIIVINLLPKSNSEEVDSATGMHQYFLIYGLSRRKAPKKTPATARASELACHKLLQNLP